MNRITQEEYNTVIIRFISGHKIIGATKETPEFFEDGVTNNKTWFKLNFPIITFLQQGRDEKGNIAQSIGLQPVCEADFTDSVKTGKFRFDQIFSVGLPESRVKDYYWRAVDSIYEKESGIQLVKGPQRIITP